MRPIAGPRLINAQSLSVFNVKTPAVLQTLTNVVVGEGVNIDRFRAALYKALKKTKLKCIKDLNCAKSDRIYVNVESDKTHRELRDSLYRKAISPVATLTLSSQQPWTSPAMMEKVCTSTAQRLETMITGVAKKKKKRKKKTATRRAGTRSTGSRTWRS